MATAAAAAMVAEALSKLQEGCGDAGEDEDVDRGKVEGGADLASPATFHFSHAYSGVSSNGDHEMTTSNATLPHNILISNSNPGGQPTNLNREGELSSALPTSREIPCVPSAALSASSTPRAGGANGSGGHMDTGSDIEVVPVSTAADARVRLTKSIDLASPHAPLLEASLAASVARPLQSTSGGMNVSPLPPLPSVIPVVKGPSGGTSSSPASPPASLALARASGGSAAAPRPSMEMTGESCPLMVAGDGR